MSQPSKGAQPGPNDKTITSAANSKPCLINNCTANLNTETPIELLPKKLETNCRALIGESDSTEERSHYLTRFNMSKIVQESELRNEHMFYCCKLKGSTPTLTSTFEETFKNSNGDKVGNVEHNMTPLSCCLTSTNGCGKHLNVHCRQNSSLEGLQSSYLDTESRLQRFQSSLTDSKSKSQDSDSSVTDPKSTSLDSKSSPAYSKSKLNNVEPKLYNLLKKQSTPVAKCKLDKSTSSLQNTKSNLRNITSKKQIKNLCEFKSNSHPNNSISADCESNSKNGKKSSLKYNKKSSSMKQIRFSNIDRVMECNQTKLNNSQNNKLQKCGLDNCERNQFTKISSESHPLLKTMLMMFLIIGFASAAPIGNWSVPIPETATFTSSPCVHQSPSTALTYERHAVNCSIFYTCFAGVSWTMACAIPNTVFSLKLKVCVWKNSNLDDCPENIQNQIITESKKFEFKNQHDLKAKNSKVKSLKNEHDKSYNSKRKSRFNFSLEDEEDDEQEEEEETQMFFISKAREVIQETGTYKSSVGEERLERNDNFTARQLRLIADQILNLNIRLNDEIASRMKPELKEKGKLNKEESKHLLSSNTKPRNSTPLTGTDSPSKNKRQNFINLATEKEHDSQTKEGDVQSFIYLKTEQQTTTNLTTKTTADLNTKTTSDLDANQQIIHEHSMKQPTISHLNGEHLMNAQAQPKKQSPAVQVQVNHITPTDATPTRAHQSTKQNYFERNAEHLYQSSVDKMDSLSKKNKNHAQEETQTAVDPTSRNSSSKSAQEANKYDFSVGEEKFKNSMENEEDEVHNEIENEEDEFHNEMENEEDEVHNEMENEEDEVHNEMENEEDEVHNEMENEQEDEDLPWRGHEHFNLHDLKKGELTEVTYGADEFSSPKEPELQKLFPNMTANVTKHTSKKYQNSLTQEQRQTRNYLTLKQLNGTIVTSNNDSTFWNEQKQNNTAPTNDNTTTAFRSAKQQTSDFKDQNLQISVDSKFQKERTGSKENKIELNEEISTDSQDLLLTTISTKKATDYVTVYADTNIGANDKRNNTTPKATTPRSQREFRRKLEILSGSMNEEPRISSEIPEIPKKQGSQENVQFKYEPRNSSSILQNPNLQGSPENPEHKYPKESQLSEDSKMRGTGYDPVSRLFKGFQNVESRTPENIVGRFKSSAVENVRKMGEDVEMEEAGLDTDSLVLDKESDARVDNSTGVLLSDDGYLYLDIESDIILDEENNVIVDTRQTAIDMNSFKIENIVDNVNVKFMNTGNGIGDRQENKEQPREVPQPTEDKNVAVKSDTYGIVSENDLQTQPGVNYKNLNSKERFHNLWTSSDSSETISKRQVSTINDVSNSKSQVSPINNDSNSKSQVSPINNDSNSKSQVSPINNDSNSKTQVSTFINDPKQSSTAKATEALRDQDTKRPTKTRLFLNTNRTGSARTVDATPSPASSRTESSTLGTEVVDSYHGRYGDSSLEFSEKIIEEGDSNNEEKQRKDEIILVEEIRKNQSIGKLEKYLDLGTVTEGTVTEGTVTEGTVRQFSQSAAIDTVLRSIEFEKVRPELGHSEPVQITSQSQVEQPQPLVQVEATPRQTESKTKLTLAKPETEATSPAQQSQTLNKSTLSTEIYSKTDLRRTKNLSIPINRLHSYKREHISKRDPNSKQPSDASIFKKWQPRQRSHSNTDSSKHRNSLRRTNLRRKQQPKNINLKNNDGNNKRNEYLHLPGKKNENYSADKFWKSVFKRVYPGVNFGKYAPKLNPKKRSNSGKFNRKETKLSLNDKSTNPGRNTEVLTDKQKINQLQELANSLAVSLSDTTELTKQLSNTAMYKAVNNPMLMKLFLHRLNKTVHRTQKIPVARKLDMSLQKGKQLSFPNVHSTLKSTFHGITNSTKDIYSRNGESSRSYRTESRDRQDGLSTRKDENKSKTMGADSSHFMNEMIIVRNEVMKSQELLREIADKENLNCVKENKCGKKNSRRINFDHGRKQSSTNSLEHGRKQSSTNSLNHGRKQSSTNSVKLDWMQEIKLVNTNTRKVDLVQRTEHELTRKGQQQTKNITTEKTRGQKHTKNIEPAKQKNDKLKNIAIIKDKLQVNKGTYKLAKNTKQIQENKEKITIIKIISQKETGKNISKTREFTKHRQDKENINKMEVTKTGKNENKNFDVTKGRSQNSKVDYKGLNLEHRRLEKQIQQRKLKLKLMQQQQQQQQHTGPPPRNEQGKPTNIKQTNKTHSGIPVPRKTETPQNQSQGHSQEKHRQQDSKLGRTINQKNGHETNIQPLQTNPKTFDQKRNLDLESLRKLITFHDNSIEDTVMKESLLKLNLEQILDSTSTKMKKFQLLKVKRHFLEILKNVTILRLQNLKTKSNPRFDKISDDDWLKMQNEVKNKPIRKNNETIVQVLRSTTASTVTEKSPHRIITTVAAPTTTSTTTAATTAIWDKSKAGLSTDRNSLPDYRKDLNEQCGVMSTPLIIGGRKSRVGQWPWQVSLQIVSSETPWHRCGGVLIHSRWVLTAAHCLEGPFYSDLSNWRVVIADHDLDTVTGTEIYRDAVRVVSHPDYARTSNLPNDVALLELGAPVDLTSGDVRTACLPEEDFPLTPGTKCWISGWGETRDSGGQENAMNEVPVEVIAHEQCKPLWGKAGIEILESHVCLGHGEAGACYGDSGGPLMCERNGRFHVTGVMSWLISNCSASNFPNVFTRLPNYMGWVNQQLDQFEGVGTRGLGWGEGL